MKRFLQFIILAPITIVSAAFAVANRHDVAISFDPFTHASDAMMIKVPLFVVLILAVMCGVVIGGSFTWFAQGRHRRALRQARGDAARWRGEAERVRQATPSPQGAYAAAQRETAAAPQRRLLAHS